MKMSIEKLVTNLLDSPQIRLLIDQKLTQLYATPEGTKAIYHTDY